MKSMLNWSAQARMTLALALALSSPGFAQAQAVTDQGQRVSTPTSQTTSGGRLPTPAGSNQSINSGAKQGQSSQMLGMAMNAATGAAFMSKCKPPEGIPFCIMGALSFAQAGVMGGAAKESGKTEGASRIGGGFDWSSPADLGSFDYNKLTEQMDPASRAAFTDFLNAGGKINPNGTFIDPSGREWKASDFKNEQAMAAAGLSPSQISALQAASAQIEADLKKKYGDQADGGPSVVAMQADGSGGGGGSRGPASEEGDSSFDDYLKGLGNPFGLSKDKQKQMVAGKALGTGDDVIGVKSDDLFMMVHRRYQEKRKTEEFVEHGDSGKGPRTEQGK